VPAGLYPVLARGLASARNARYPSLDALLADVEHAITHPRRRGRRIVLAVVAVAASAAGVFAIARAKTADPSETPAADSPATAGPVPVATPAPAPARIPAAPQPEATTTPEQALTGRMQTVLERFVAWSRDHAGAPCPDLAALDVSDRDAQDPWGHTIRITCTDQPGDQIVGAISVGPDGVMGTADDVASWRLSSEVTSLVHGPRWVVAAKPAGKRHRASGSRPVTKKTTPRADDRLDEIGIPLKR
jgi:hypothetical protein